MNGLPENSSGKIVGKRARDKKQQSRALLLIAEECPALLKSESVLFNNYTISCSFS